MLPVVDFHVGNRYGSLRVLSVVRKGRYRYYRCLCDCGRTLDRAASKGLSHRSHCGGNLHRITHGHCCGPKDSPTLVSWQRMMRRCYKPQSDRFKSYGAKGVKVARRWHKFAGFLADMGPRPEGTTLGRVLDRGDYKPGNCFWMTSAEQGLHKRNNNGLRKWEESRD